ncbi:hypothetical protein GCM10020219_092470 [Nonomuraea dietziae]
MPLTPGSNIPAAVPDKNAITSNRAYGGAPSRKATATTPWVTTLTTSAPIIRRRAPIRSATTPPNTMTSTADAVQMAST